MARTDTSTWTPSGRTIVRVLAIVSQPLATYGLHDLVEHTRGLTWCGAAPSVEAAVSAILRFHPHVVLVDSRVDPDAGEIRALREARPGVRVIGLARDDHTAGYLRAIRAGHLNGLVLQSASADVLVTAIRASLGVRPYLDPQLARWLAVGNSEPPDAVPAESDQLTQRQLDILTQIAAGRRYSEIARELGLSVSTIRTHVKHITDRLAARDRAHAVALGYELGLLGAPVVRPVGPGETPATRE
ncbi:response regulator transcription factor [Amycolatopsis sp. SID8362]|uniref:LuxR C-terminal-related transcriptional regulator n=1 Tax=Amycolatopsis sp. SID8362 TaxID=2690346 RepID=UPI00136E8744|nr:response regulator transcription factor [Amycolatopsis sp. SID8362]NBH10152.1 hypothetical protein [Amycolatopsis sp. SID8362]NED46847.1 response regulator transcription factor [Amycolatopsis sp. SID8362]